MNTAQCVFSRRLLPILMVIITMFGVFSMPAYAKTYGSTGSSTISVTTKAYYYYPGSSSITLRQDKQTMTYRAILGSKTKTTSGYYGCYNIKVYNITKNTTQNKTWNGGRDYKISLSPNCNYKITVTYNYALTILRNGPVGYTFSGINGPYWRVNSTWKVPSYY